MDGELFPARAESAHPQRQREKLAGGAGAERVSTRARRARSRHRGRWRLPCRALLRAEGRARPSALASHRLSGAGTASEIHGEALALLRGRRTRFYPHHEPSGAGGKAVSKWAAQFAAIGATVDAFDFAGLRKADGSAVKDLNDCTTIHPDDAGELESLLP